MTAFSISSPTSLLLTPSHIDFAQFERGLEAMRLDPQLARLGFRAPNAFVNAEMLAGMGVRCVVCNRNKIPPPQWQKIATCDPATLVRWEMRYREGYGRMVGRFGTETWRHEHFQSPNFSALAGREGGVWILDRDGHAGRVRLEELERKLGPLPATWTVTTGRDDGGTHYWYRAEPTGPDLKTVAHAMIAGERGAIDQKGRGGHAVIPGSLHRSGRRYEWAQGCAPDEIALASLPPVWLAALDYADEKHVPGPRNHGTGTSWRRGLDNDPSARFIGDGDGRGGFHGPINWNCCAFIAKFWPDGDLDLLKARLKRTILAAPRNRPEADVLRYADDHYLDSAIDSARRFIAQCKNINQHEME